MIALLKEIIPRFIEEDVALVDGRDGVQVLCAAEDLHIWDEYDYIGSAKALAWLGWRFFVTVTYEVNDD